MPHLEYCGDGHANYVQAATNPFFFGSDNAERKEMTRRVNGNTSSNYEMKKKKEWRGTLSLHAIANDARSSSLDMHPSPAVSGERQGLVKERKKNGTATRSKVVGQVLELFII